MRSRDCPVIFKIKEVITKGLIVEYIARILARISLKRLIKDLYIVNKVIKVMKDLDPVTNEDHKWHH